MLSFIQLHVVIPIPKVGNCLGVEALEIRALVTMPLNNITHEAIKNVGIMLISVFGSWVTIATT